MFILRILGGLLIVFGVIFCITIVGLAVGIPMILIGLLMVFVGKKRSPVIVQVHNVNPSK